jgi:hypothetical protein
MKRFTCVAVITASLSACVSVTKPIDLGNGSYMISLNAHGGFHGDGALLQETIEHAQAFCAQSGKRAVIESEQHGGVQMWTPQDNQVTFHCAP